MRVVIYLITVALFLAPVFYWLARFTTRSDNQNGYDFFGGRRSLFGGSRDSTVGAYRRQVREHQRMNDSRAEALMARPVERTQTETETTTRTETAA